MFQASMRRCGFKVSRWGGRGASLPWCSSIPVFISRLRSRKGRRFPSLCASPSLCLFRLWALSSSISTILRPSVSFSTHGFCPRMVLSLNFKLEGKASCQLRSPKPSVSLSFTLGHIPPCFCFFWLCVYVTRGGGGVVIILDFFMLWNFFRGRCHDQRIPEHWDTSDKFLLDSLLALSCKTENDPALVTSHFRADP